MPVSDEQAQTNRFLRCVMLKIAVVTTRDIGKFSPSAADAGLDRDPFLG